MSNKNIFVLMTVHQLVTFVHTKQCCVQFLACETYITTLYILHFPQQYLLLFSSQLGHMALPQHLEYSNYVWKNEIHINQVINVNRPMKSIGAREVGWLKFFGFSINIFVPKKVSSPGIVPLAAKPTLSKHLPQKIPTSHSWGSGGYLSAHGRLQSITMNQSCSFSSSFAKNIPHLTRGLQTKKPNKHRKEQGLKEGMGWLRRGRKSK